jgi:hypothetical protein
MTKFRVMARTVPIVQRDDRGLEIGRSYYDQGAVIELDPKDAQTVRYVELEAILDLQAAARKEAADRKAEAQRLMLMAKDAQARAEALQAEANDTAAGSREPAKEDLPPQQGGPAVDTKVKESTPERQDSNK